MHLASQATIDLMFDALNQMPNKNCFVRELHYLGSDVRGFLSHLNPEAEISLISGGCLSSNNYGESGGTELWSWKPNTGWYQISIEDDLIHPWEHGGLEGVDGEYI